MNATAINGTRRQSLNHGWLFRRLPDALAAAVRVDLPHSPFVSDLEGNEPWFGVCIYERRLPVPPLAPGMRLALYVGAAMQTTRVLVDGIEVGTNEGGYLPFEIDLTAPARGRGEITLQLELDNRHRDTVPPGKPYEELDFCWYGGLHQEVELRVFPPVHLTDSVRPGSAAGGIFVRTEAIVGGDAQLAVTAEAANARSDGARVRLAWTVFDATGREVAHRVSATHELLPGQRQGFVDAVTVPGARLWSIEDPHLHRLRVVLLDIVSGAELDRQTVNFGIRHLAFSRSGGFVLNGRRRRLRGVNRHQDFPRVGYAAPRAAQYREARRIKEAGFDYIRLSHYPQSPHFLDACDAYGIVVANCIPGWQFFGCEAFQENCADFARRLVRRDRNHPCVVLWELSLNETQMSVGFMQRMHEIGHEEYPGDQMFTCGWMDGFDVFLHSRQHGEIHTWRNDDKALVVAEYGDWEYYADNEGFDQKSGTGILDRRYNSRKFRGDGEVGLMQQVRNHVEALNDTLSSPAVLDGLWAMNDYPRGYEQTRAACGVMDFFRLPKFSYPFFRSQRDPDEGGPPHAWRGGPMVFAATHWIAPLPGDELWVFSNCETVELQLDGRTLAAPRGPERARWAHLPHPPFVFTGLAFGPGTLTALGRIDGVETARHDVRTPGAPVALRLWSDARVHRRHADETDMLLVHAALVDPHGTDCVQSAGTVRFAATGGAEIIGPVVVPTEAGVASIVLHVPVGVTSYGVRAAGDAPAGIADATWTAAEHTSPDTLLISVDPLVT